MEKMSTEKRPITPASYIGENGVRLDSMGRYIWAKDEKCGDKLIAEVRGWGDIQYRFSTEEDSGAFQDQLGQFIVDAINEKLKNADAAKLAESHEKEIEAAFNAGFQKKVMQEAMAISFNTELNLLRGELGAEKAKAAKLVEALEVIRDSYCYKYEYGGGFVPKVISKYLNPAGIKINEALKAHKEGGEVNCLPKPEPIGYAHVLGDIIHSIDGGPVEFRIYKAGGLRELLGWKAEYMFVIKTETSSYRLFSDDLDYLTSIVAALGECKTSQNIEALIEFHKFEGGAGK